MLIDFGKSNFINKIKSQPDKVQEVISKVKNDGLLSTYEAVKHKLDEPFSLGYCSSGEVIQSKCEIFSIGDRVATNGPHAEIYAVPKNLAIKIDPNVSYEDAAFIPLASVALQSIRNLDPKIGGKYKRHWFGYRWFACCKNFNCKWMQCICI